MIDPAYIITLRDLVMDKRIPLEDIVNPCLVQRQARAEDAVHLWHVTLRRLDGLASIRAIPMYRLKHSYAIYTFDTQEFEDVCVVFIANCASVCVCLFILYIDVVQVLACESLRLPASLDSTCVCHTDMRVAYDVKSKFGNSATWLPCSRSR